MRAINAGDQLLLEMDAARDRIAEAIAGLSEERMLDPGIDSWSVKDHLAHLTFWHEMRFFEVSRVARGGSAGFPVLDVVDGVDPIDEINERFAANRRSVPLAQVLADLDFAREMVRQAIEACPEDRLDLSLYPEIGPNGAGHDIAHADIIADWRKREGI
jgi:DinB family protein